MWYTKIFKTRDQMEAWLTANQGKVQWEEVAVNNALGVLYRKLRQIG